MPAPRLSFVLVGPFADPRLLSRWAHEEFRRSEAVAFIGVDSGTGPLLESGLPAAVSIGDFDGPMRSRPKDIPSIRLPRDKERSDLAFALQFCISRSAAEIFAVGFQGGRSDHDLGVHLDLAAASARVPRVVSIGARGAVVYLSARHAPLALSARDMARLRRALAKPHRASKTVSIFPIGAPARGVSLRGLRFQPPGGILSLSSQGLSNELRGTKLRVGVARGTLAIFFPS